MQSVNGRLNRLKQKLKEYTASSPRESCDDRYIKLRENIEWHWMAWDSVDDMEWHGIASDGIGWHRIAWDGMGRHRMAQDGIGWHGIASDGIGGMRWLWMARDGIG